MGGISYARYSTERQNEASIADQLRVCREYATARGWTLTAEYTDEGISGAALGNRPGVQRALAALATGDRLIVNDLSRLSRSQDLAPLLTRLRHRGIRVIGVQDGFDSDSPTARMQAGLSGIMSEEYRAMISARTHSALKLRAEQGKPTGGKPYDQDAITREIFHRFASGETMKAIAADLNRRGIPSPGANWKSRNGTRGRWLVSALHAILHNEKYVGRKVWNRARMVKDPDTGKRTRVLRHESEWIVRETESLIDPATWRKVQARFTRTTKGRGGQPRYLLSGLLECALCGSKLIVVGGSQHRYVCGTYHGGGEHACSNRLSVPREIAEELILEPVINDLLSPAAIAEAVKAMRVERAQAEKPMLNREVVELERLVREGLLSREVAAPALIEARRKDQPVELPWPTEKLWREGVREMRNVLRGDDVLAAREVLRELLGTVRCTPAEDHVIAELTARTVLLATGSGRWVGSGGGVRIHLPVSSKSSSHFVLMA